VHERGQVGWGVPHEVIRWDVGQDQGYRI
jgi:hypothetical protein